MNKTTIISMHIGFWLIVFFIFIYATATMVYDKHFTTYIFATSIESNPEIKTHNHIEFHPSVFEDYNPYSDKMVYMLSAMLIGYNPIFFYLAYFLMPFILKRKKWLLLPVALLAAYYIYDVISQGNNTFRYTESAREIGFIIIFAALGFLIRIIPDWYKNEKAKRQLEKQNIQSELNMLKNQISPHFFFNTMNNIDSLIKSNADKASATLVKLSDIMRYMIYETNVDQVPINNEIEYIYNYIDLQKIQYSNKELVSIETPGNYDRIKVAPMLFIPFVENAFKHCTNKDVPNAIAINFSVAANKLHFECRNAFEKDLKINKDSASGIGLSVIKRRLEILYPSKHYLNITENNKTYKVNLVLDINED